MRFQWHHSFYNVAWTNGYISKNVDLTHTIYKNTFQICEKIKLLRFNMENDYIKWNREEFVK